MNKITWIIFTLFSVGIFGLMIYVANQSKIDLSGIDVTASQVGSKDSGNIADHVYGNANAKVVLIEYADYQCAGCADVYPIIKAAVDAYKDDVKLIFRSFPLTTIHANAKISAASTEAAGLQGKFWEMHDQIFGGQSDWSTLTGDDRTEYFVDLAKGLGLDTAKFKEDLGSDAVSQKIAFDQALANKAGVNQTPTLYLNGKILDGTTLNDVDSLKKALKEAIK